MAMSMAGLNSAILAALARMRLCTSLYVTRKCSGSCAAMSVSSFFAFCCCQWMIWECLGREAYGEGKGGERERILRRARRADRD